MINRLHFNPRIVTLIGLVAACLSSSHADEKIWTNPERAAAEDPDFLIQGEYASKEKPAKKGKHAKLAAQVVALGEGIFDAYILEGGLPGAGWKPDKMRLKLSGKRDGDKVTFSAHEGYAASIQNGAITIQSKDGTTATLPRIERRSPTLGAKPPENATVLFDGSSAEHWKNGKMEDGLLVANNTLSKKTFGDCTIHLEFRTPYKPHARGQKRGNSGVYYGGRWETQILDSFGLSGRMNQCGGIYSIAAPQLNMCLPPLRWQTYDVELTAARFDADGVRTAWPRITVKLNGVTVHTDLELDKTHTTASPISGPLKPGGMPIFLQDHQNPVHFRNIWVEEKPDPRETDDSNLPRVLVIGDSISMNYHDAAKQALDGIANYHRIEGNASNVKNGVRKAPTWLGNYHEKGLHWDVIQFNHGLHDLKQKYDSKTETWGDYSVPLETYQQNLEKLIGILKQTDAVLIWCSTTPVPNSNKGRYARRQGAAADFNRAAAEVIKKHPEILVTDLYQTVDEAPAFDAWRKGRDVHFYRKEEREILGKAVAATIRRALDE